LAHVAIEYVIMVPVLILQIFLFPLAANSLMNIWVESRKNLTLQETASHLGSAMQQLYSALNHKTISTGKATYSPQLSPLIENQYYTITGKLVTVLDPAMKPTKILKLTLVLANAGTRVTTSVLLGPDALWKNSTLVSTSSNAYISATKNSTGITLQFGG